MENRRRMEGERIERKMWVIEGRRKWKWGKGKTKEKGRLKKHDRQTTIIKNINFLISL